MSRCLYILESVTYEKGKREYDCHGLMIFQEGEKLEVIGDPFYVEQAGWYVGVTMEGEEPVPVSTAFIDHCYLTGVMRTFFDLELELNYHTYKIDEALKHRNERLFFTHTAAYRKIRKLMTEPVEVEKNGSGSQKSTRR